MSIPVKTPFSYSIFRLPINYIFGSEAYIRPLRKSFPGRRLMPLKSMTNKSAFLSGCNYACVIARHATSRRLLSRLLLYLQSLSWTSLMDAFAKARHFYIFAKLRLSFDAIRLFLWLLSLINQL